MTDTFGSRLRRARELRQIALADIAAQTKIKASLFEGLERDDVSHWPTGIFRRSFIRAYAQAVGLDADDTVREFAERFPDPAAPPAAVEGGIPEGRPPAVMPLPAPAPSLREHLPQSAAPAGLRLTLVETWAPFMGGRVLADARRRWSAAAWDLGSLVATALTLYVITGAFWMPLGATALCYYVGAVLLLGNSPGVCLFAPRPDGQEGPGGGRLRRRTRQAEPPPVRHAEPAFRTRRWKDARA